MKFEFIIKDPAFFSSTGLVDVNGFPDIPVHLVILKYFVKLFEFEEEFAKTSIDDLTEMLVPVYKKYMTKEDLKELIEFYETPVGRKFAEYTPIIMQESMQIGQQWGLKIGQDFERKMMERGY